jgi:hypothetical protein
VLHLLRNISLTINYGTLFVILVIVYIYIYIYIYMVQKPNYHQLIMAMEGTSKFMKKGCLC